MKTLLVLLSLFTFACVKVEEPKGEADPSPSLQRLSKNFKYQMMSLIKINHLPEYDGKGLPANHPVSVYTKSPEDGGDLLGVLITDNSGRLYGHMKIIRGLDQVYLLYRYVGFVQGEYINYEVVKFTADYKYRRIHQSFWDVLIPKAYAQSSFQSNTPYYYEYNFIGVPQGIANKEVSQDFLDAINSSLPEGKPVPTFHPQYIGDNESSNICVSSQADAEITFIHEGAGYRNALGVFYFDPNNVPATIDDIEDSNIIFPNVSYRYSGGWLRTGDNLVIPPISAGKCLGFFIVANGWWGNGVDLGRQKYFSINEFNPEKTFDNRQHVAVLKYEENESFLLGFEDLQRDGWSDDDFNDAVFEINITPYTAVTNIASIQPTDIDLDSDNDGTSDQFDQYPNDSSLSFNNYYPSENGHGTLAFEDLWPIQGDYDFNDFMTYYRMNYVTNAQNKIKEIRFSFDFIASGASYQNSLAIEIPMAWDEIESVSGNIATSERFIYRDNGTEAGQTNAVIMIADDINKVIPRFANVFHNEQIHRPETVDVRVILKTPQTITESLLPPYKPFLIQNKQRGIEIHLAGNNPTDLFTGENLFGTLDDNSLAGTKFMNNEHMPWAINYPVKLQPTLERENIRNIYYFFNSWANSAGFNYMDWYEDKENYRNSEKLINIGE